VRSLGQGLAQADATAAIGTGFGRLRPPRRRRTARPDVPRRGVRDDLHVTVQVRPEDRRGVDIGERRQRLGGRVSVLVPGACRDHGDRRPGPGEEFGAARRARAVVTDLEQLDRSHQLALHEGPLDRFLGVACQEGVEGTVP
jgi:hypothetical protein